MNIPNQYKTDPIISMYLESFSQGIRGANKGHLADVNWLIYKGTDVLSFNWYCGLLGLDPDRIRDLILLRPAPQVAWCWLLQESD
jgi:hypothetical protein